MSKNNLSMLDAMLHELKNPLTGISVVSDILDSPEGSVSKDIMDKSIELLSQSSKDALEIVKHMTEYSQSELNGLEIKPERIEVISTLRSIVEAKAKKASLMKDMKVQFHSTLDECYIDFTKILVQLLVTNLIVNAIKHSGGSNLTVSLAQNSSDGKRVQISFEDDGIGIPKREMNSIFAPFKRGSNAQDGDGGQGIGLALVKQILEAHGGDISVVAGLEGKGACFIVSLLIPE
jgi:signal transduction histidine kinase